jgi:hypothetical protein
VSKFLADALAAYTERADISGVMGSVEQLLDESVAAQEHLISDSDAEALFDLAAVDWEGLTDTAIAVTICRELAAAYPVFQLPPVAITCSHEHSAWPGTVSISALTLTSVVSDISGSLRVAIQVANKPAQPG